MIASDCRGFLPASARRAARCAAGQAVHGSTSAVIGCVSWNDSSYTELSGRHAGHALEVTTEVALVGEAHRTRDFGQRGFARTRAHTGISRTRKACSPQL